MIINKRYETIPNTFGSTVFDVELRRNEQYSIFKEHIKKNHELIKTHKISFFIV